MDVVRNHRGRRVGPHTAGVVAGVAIAHALMVLAAGQRQDVRAIDHGDETGLLAFEAFLDDHAVAGVTEGVAGQHVAHGVFRLFERFRHDHALAGGQPVGLDHDGGALFAHVVQRRFRIREGAVFGGRNGVSCEKVLGKALGAFQLGRRFTWPEYGDAGLAQPVGDARHQRCLRADDDEIDGIVGREADQPFDVVVRQRHVLNPRFPGCTGVTGRGVDLLDRG